VNGRTSTCNSIVTVIDTVRPVANCQNISVHLNAAGSATVTGAMINNGSTDACGIASLSASPSVFSCANIGPNNVTLTVTDVNGRTSTCTSVVTVMDTVRPVANCRNISVYLNPAGSATVTGAMINNGSTDACGIASLSASPSVFSCANIGPNNVTLTVTDVNGRTSTWCVQWRFVNQD
jgi:prophage tail gpP-like protein